MSNQTMTIKDKLNRPLRDIRISVIDKCNFRCTYCMPAEIFGDSYKFLPQEELLSFDEITRITTNFARLGVKKIRLTGGEPLLRKNLHELIAQLATIEGIEDIALTTNGVHLPKQATLLKEAGLERVNVSLDALDEEIFKHMNGRHVGVKPVLKGIEAARKAGLDVKINMVVRRGTNDSQILPMAKYFKEEGITLRYIEFMDVGSTNGWDLSQVVTKKEIHHILQNAFTLERMDPDYYGEVAKRYRYSGTDTEVGFISSVSEAFCSTCTRARVSCDGKLYTCLFASNGFDLRSLVRSNCTEEELQHAIAHVWGNRGDRYSEERTEYSKKDIKKIEMSYIGG